MTDSPRSGPQGLWTAGEGYTPYVGRWSRLVAADFVRWLAAPPGGDWIDVGCGTGELSEAILRAAAPRSLLGIDPSAEFLAVARRDIRDDRIAFESGDALAIPRGDASADAVVSGLVLNFVPDVAAAVREFSRVARAGAIVAAYVWDYADGMQMMRYFWDAAVDLDPASAEHDEGRFDLCRPDALASLFTGGGLSAVETRAIDVPTRFAGFDDYWQPFLAGPGPAPRYARTLDDAQLNQLRDLLRSRLPIAEDGSIALIARAWAVKGTR